MLHLTEPVGYLDNVTLMHNARPLYWDGKTAERIVQALLAEGG